MTGFARLGAVGTEIPVLHADGLTYDLRPLTTDIDGAFFASDGIARARAAVAAGELRELDGAEALRVGAPLAQPGKIVCIGLNYRDHAEETGAEIPSEPVIFMKDPSTIVGAFDEVLIPRRSLKTDWEVELGVVIGSTARYLESPGHALAHVAGYVVSHDVSEREFQLERGGQWDKGKGCDSFGPIGPWLVTQDEIVDPQALRLWLEVNGERMQDSSTSDMIFSCTEIVSYVSRFMTLLPGDVICTGTPQGVGMGRGRFLKLGDKIRLGVEGLGEQQQTVIATR